MVVLEKVDLREAKSNHKILTEGIVERGRVVLVDPQQRVHPDVVVVGVRGDALHWDRHLESKLRKGLTLSQCQRGRRSGWGEDGMIFRDTKKEDEVKWRGVATSEIHFLLLVPRISFTFPRRPQLQFKWMRSCEVEVRVRMSLPRLPTGQECQFVAHATSWSLGMGTTMGWWKMAEPLVEWERNESRSGIGVAGCWCCWWIRTHLLQRQQFQVPEPGERGSPSLFSLSLSVAQNLLRNFYEEQLSQILVPDAGYTGVSWYGRVCELGSSRRSTARSTADTTSLRTSNCIFSATAFFFLP